MYYIKKKKKTLLNNQIHKNKNIKIVKKKKIRVNISYENNF